MEITSVKLNSFTIYGYDQDYIISKIKETSNFYEIKELSEWNKYFNNVNIIFDVGANIGNHSIYWSQFDNIKEIVAFEPIEKNFEILKKNIEENNIHKVKLEKKGLGDKKGFANITAQQKNNFGAISLTYIEEPSNIEIITGDNFLFDNNYSGIDLIKIDVEEFEINVLKGFKQSIKKYKPIIWVEVSLDTVTNVLDILKKNDYYIMANNNFNLLAMHKNECRDFKEISKEELIFNLTKNLDESWTNRKKFLVSNERRIQENAKYIKSNELLNKTVNKLELVESQLIPVKEHTNYIESQLKKTENKLRVNVNKSNQIKLEIKKYKNRLENKNRIVNDLKIENNRLVTPNLELEYFSGDGRSITQRLISKFPSLFILVNFNKTGFKNALLTIKGFKSIKRNKLFDIGYYLNNNGDIKLSGVDPLLHYLYHGFKEKRDPSSRFKTSYYLEEYPDVKNSKISPLVHYSLYGIKEGRSATDQDDNNLQCNLKLLDARVIKLENMLQNYVDTKNRTEERVIKLENMLQNYVDTKNRTEERVIKLENMLQNYVDTKNRTEERVRKLEKYNRLYTINQINKDKISCEIENFNDYGLIKEKRNPKIIVSMTSFPDRMYDIHFTLYSLLTQTLKPDEVILWLSKEEFPNLEEEVPKKVIEFKQQGLTIKWIEENLKSYKKLVCSLQEYPDDIIVTADDDIFYQKDWLEKLYTEYDGKNILCHRAHQVHFDGNTIKPYSEWSSCIDTSEASFSNFITGVGGTLYPPNCLYKDILSKEIYEKIVPDTDDVWFWAMALMNDTKIKVIKNNYKQVMYTNPKRELGFSKESTLFSKNKINGNDEAIKKIIKKYPEIIEKLKKEISFKVSVIVPIYNNEKYLKECLESITNQTLKDIEIICINDGSTDNSLEILEKFAVNDDRIKIINQKNQGASIARNNGMKIATGEYIGFVDSDDWIDSNFYETLYYEAKSKNADLARTGYKYELKNVSKNDNLNNLISKRKINNELLRVNDHSVVIWNAIYRRTYLQDNNIYYFDDIICCNDVPFTARATFYSGKSIPATGTYYHHRDNENQLTTFNISRVEFVLTSNKITLDFINSVNYLEKKEYLTAFKRCIWRYDDIFKRALKLPEFNQKEQELYFIEFVDGFFSCKYLEEFKKYYNEPYFDYMDKKEFDSYVNSQKQGSNLTTI